MACPCPVLALSSRLWGGDLRPVALLVLLTTAAGTGIVTANSPRHSRTSRLIGSRTTPISTPTAAALTCVSSRSYRFRTVITIAFGLPAGPGKIIDICAQLARHFTLWFWLLDPQGNFAAHEFEQFIYDIVLDG